MRIKKHYINQCELDWLAEYLGDRSYDLNLGMGGPGWRYRWDRDGYYLVIDNEAVGLMYMLKWGDLGGQAINS